MQPAEEAPAEEEEDDGTAAAAAGAAAAGAGAAAAGAAVAAGGDDDDEETAMAPTIVPGDAFAPGPAGTRDFDFGDVAEGPAQCTTLRDGLVNASPVLQSALPSVRIPYCCKRCMIFVQDMPRVVRDPHPDQMA